MKIKHSDHARLKATIAALAIVLAVAGSLAAVASAAPVADSPYNVTLDDPDNETVEVELDFDEDATADVELTDGDVVYEDTTVDGTADETETATIEPTSSTPADEQLQLAVDSDDADNVSIAETTIIKEATVNVTDADNESVTVDAAFAGGEDANASVSIVDSTDAGLVNDTIEYIDSQHDDGATLTREYNSSDGLVDDEVTVEIETSPATAYDAAYAQVSDGGSGGGGLIGGDIAGQDPTVAIGAVVVIGGLLYYGRQEDWL